MARFLLRFASFTAIQLAVLAYVIYAGKVSDDTYFGAMNDKLERLQTISGPRLIVVGGSNAVFGIDSQTLGQNLPSIPVNMALHAGVGYEVYLELVEAHVRAGDVVVFIPEYEFLGGEANQDLQQDFLAACPSMRPYFYPGESSWSRWKSTLDRESLQTLHTWTHNAFRRIDRNSSVYSRGSFNEFGDMVGHYGQAASDKNPFGPIGVAESRFKTFIERVNRFGDRCHQAGAQVYLSFAPIDPKRFEQSREVLEMIDRRLNDELRITVVDHPQDSLFAQNEFFDSYYHLNQSAAQRRSARLNQLLVTRVANANSSTDSGDSVGRLQR